MARTVLALLDARVALSPATIAAELVCKIQNGENHDHKSTCFLEPNPVLPSRPR
jgi:hypothetical protein